MPGQTRQGMVLCVRKRQNMLQLNKECCAFGKIIFKWRIAIPKAHMESKTYEIYYRNNWGHVKNNLQLTKAVGEANRS